MRLVKIDDAIINVDEILYVLPYDSGCNIVFRGGEQLDLESNLEEVEKIISVQTPLLLTEDL